MTGDKYSIKVNADLVVPPFLDGGEITMTEPQTIAGCKRSELLWPTKTLIDEEAIEREVQGDLAVRIKPSNMVQEFPVISELLNLIRENQVLVMGIIYPQLIDHLETNMDRQIVWVGEWAGQQCGIKQVSEHELLQEIIKDPDIEKYDLIVLDVPYIRKQTSAVLLGMLKRVASHRLDFRLIIKSDDKIISDFMGGAPMFYKKTPPTILVYHPTPVGDYIGDALDQMISLHFSPAVGDIVVYVSHEEEIQPACCALKERLGYLDPAPGEEGEETPLMIIALYPNMQGHIFQQADREGARRCFITTDLKECRNILNGVRGIVDSGYRKLRMYNPQLYLDIWRILPMGKTATERRIKCFSAGGENTCYCMYSEDNTLAAAAEMHEMQRINISGTLLYLKAANIEICDFDFVDAPKLLHPGLIELWILGALDKFGKVTGIGMKMRRFPLPPQLSKMLLVAEMEGCVDEVLTIVSMLETDYFSSPSARMQSILQDHVVKESDYLTLLRLFNIWKSNDDFGAWDNALIECLKAAQKVKDHLLKVSEELQIQVPLNPVFNWQEKDWQEKVRKCICAAYIQKLAVRTADHSYRILNSGLHCLVDSSSSILSTETPVDYIVYGDAVLVEEKVYLKGVTMVDPGWVVGYEPPIFSV